MASHKVDEREQKLDQHALETPQKRGRGRPRKQGVDTPEGSNVKLRTSLDCTPDDSLVSMSKGTPSGDTPGKRSRGRPKKQKVDTAVHADLGQDQTCLKEESSATFSEESLEKSTNKTDHQLPEPPSVSTAKSSHSDLNIVEDSTKKNCSTIVLEGKHSPETPKRRPGRPKKQKLDTSQESHENSKISKISTQGDQMASVLEGTPEGNVPGKKGRRRPKKQSIGPTDVRHTEMTLEVSGTPGPVTEDHGTPTMVTPVKRGRGRPPKQTAESAYSQADQTAGGSLEEGDKTIPDLLSKRKLGRPRKKKEDLPDIGDAFSNNNQDKVQNNDMSVSLSEENHKGTLAHTPRTGGRRGPKKQTDSGADASYPDVNSSVSSALQTSTENLHALHERPEDISFGSNSATQVVVKKRRGRPPKIRPMDDSSDSINTSLDLSAPMPVMCSTPRGKEKKLSVQCVHCDATFIGLPTYRTHLMSKHHRIYKSDVPEGVFNPSMVLKSLKCIKCLLCGKSYSEMPAFGRHVKWCGREMETQTCEVCQEVVKVMRYQNHMRKHTAPEPEIVEAKETEQQDDCNTSQGGGRGQRRAAQRAMRSFQDDSRISAEESAEEESQSDCFAVNGKNMDEMVNEDDLESEASAVDLEGAFPRHRKKYPKKFKSYNITRGTLRETDTDTTWPYYSEQAEEASADSMLEDTLQWFKEHECEDLFLQWLPSADTCKLSEKHPEDHKESLDISGDIVSSRHGIAKAEQVVWRLAWCPLPLEADKTATTYLALACNSAPSESTEDSFASSPACSTIQLWSCGELQDSISTLELCYSIRVDQGRIWDMKWCPTGAWQSPASQTSSKTTLPRIGLLAVALSNGEVDILSVPHPGSVTKDAQEGSVHLQLEPSVSLLCSPVKESDAQCLCLDWGMKDQCETVCAGFSNGLIAVWKLHAQSSLQMVFSGGRRLLPSLTFPAHHGAVTGLALCPNTNCYLATGSVNKEVRVWDLREVSQPLQELTCNRVTKIVWPLNWFSVCAASDTIDSHGNNPVTQVAYGLEATYRPILQHSACVWGIDHSPWLNAIVSCDSGGAICSMQTGSVTGRAGDRKVLEARRAWLLEQKKSLQYLATEAKGKDNVCDTPETSLHCVAFNPNYKSHLWLACGGFNGKVHIKQTSFNAIT